MKFSFIIPIYNGEKFINKTVREIGQTNLEDYEVILVNDGSTDNSEFICDTLAKENKKIHCIHQRNHGVSSARNNGLKAATGEYVLFLDADDMLETRRLSKLLEEIEKTKGIDMAIFGISFDYYYRGKLYRRDEMSPPLSGIQNSKIWMKNMLMMYYTNSLSPVWNKVFRRRFLLDNSLYLREDMFLYEDLEYSVRCMMCCDNILFEPEIIYHYRQSDDEGNAGRRLAKIDHIFNLVDQIENVLDKLINLKSTKSEQDEIKSILVLLYLVLAREKIAVSNVRQVKQICDDYKKWYEKRQIKIPLESQEYSDLLLQRNVLKLILRREYTKVRHRIAVVLKNTRIYQKLKG